MEVVIFSGGRGTRALLDGLFSPEFGVGPDVRPTLIVNAYDNGRSTAIVRRMFSILGPSDSRKTMAVLLDRSYPAGVAAETFFGLRFGRDDDNDAGREEELFGAIAAGDEAVLRQFRKGNLFLALEGRFRTAVQCGLGEYLAVSTRLEEPVDYSDFSLMNAVFAGLTRNHDGDLQAVTDDLAAILPLRGEILLNSRRNLFVYGVREYGTGEGLTILDEAEMVSLRSSVRLKEIVLLDRELSPAERESLEREPADVAAEQLEGMAVIPDVTDRVSEALGRADLIVYGPGTQHSSLLPTYMTRGLADSIAANHRARKVLVTNIGEDYDSRGYSAADIFQHAVDALNRGSGRAHSDASLVTDVLVNRPIHERAGLLQPNLRFFENNVHAHVVSDASSTRDACAEDGRTVNVVFTPLEDAGEHAGRHDAQRLAQAISTITRRRPPWTDHLRQRLAAGAIVFDVDETVLDVRVSTQERYEQTLLEAPVREALAELLRAGFRLCAVTGNSLERFHERFTRHLAARLKSDDELHLIERFEAYGNGAATHVTFSVQDGEAKPVPDEAYNAGNVIDRSDWQPMREALGQLCESATDLYPPHHELLRDYDPGIWQYCYDKDGACWREPSSDRRLPWVAERGQAMFTIKPFPSVKHVRQGRHVDVDVRTRVLGRVRAALEEALGEHVHGYSIRAGGWSSIDITRHLSKVTAVQHFMTRHALTGTDVIYFGNEFRMGGNDMSVAESVPGIHVVSVNQPEDAILALANVFYGGGRGTASTLQQLGDILERFTESLGTGLTEGPDSLASAVPAIQEKIHALYDAKIARQRRRLAKSRRSPVIRRFHRHLAVVRAQIAELALEDAGGVHLIIPAGGYGSRLGSDTPKPLFPIAGKPSVLYGIESFSPFVDSITVVAPAGIAESLQPLLASSLAPVEFVIDDSHRGDWHGVSLAVSRARASRHTLVAWSDLVVLNGDRIEGALVEHIHSGNDMTVPTMLERDPYVAILTDDRDNAIEGVFRHERDAVQGYLQHDCSFFVFHTDALCEGLAELTSRHQSMTGRDDAKRRPVKFIHIIDALHGMGRRVKVLPICRDGDFVGFNTREEAARIASRFHGV